MKSMRLLTLIAAVFAATLAIAADVPNAQFNGTWILNESESDRPPRPHGLSPGGGPGMGPGQPGMGPGMGPSGPGMGPGGPGMGPGGPGGMGRAGGRGGMRPRSGEEGGRPGGGPQGVQKETTIRVSGDTVVFENPDGWARTFNTAPGSAPTGRVSQATARWSGGKLVIATSHPNGAKTIETFSVDADRKRMTVETRFEGTEPPPIKRVYEQKK